jgi:hypothetical protein
VAKAENGVLVEVGGRGKDTDGAQGLPDQAYKWSQGYAEPCEVETMSGGVIELGQSMRLAFDHCRLAS